MKDLIDNAKEIERIKVQLENAQKDIDSNFEQHKEFYEMKKMVGVINTLPAKVEKLEESRDEMKGALKMVYIIGGIVAFVITTIIALIGLS